jgi:hypothetical protein
MKIADLDMLGYLHDATVSSIKYEMGQGGARNVEIFCLCHRDSGYEEWNDKTIKVTLKETIILSHFLCGYTVGREEIDRWEWSLSPTMEDKIRKLEEIRLNCAGIRFAVFFHTGSHIEGICREIDLVIN